MSELGASVDVGSALPACLLLLLAFFSRYVLGSWLAPGAAWPGFWAGATCLPLLLAPKYPVSPAAIWAILGYSTVVAVSAGAGQLSQYAYRAPGEITPPRQNVLRFLCWSSLFAGFAMVAITLAQHNASWRVWLNPVELARIAGQISIARYHGGEEEPVLVRLCLVATYLGSLAGGHAMAWRRPRAWRLWSICPIGGALIYTVLTTAKAGLLISILLWISAYCAQRIRRTGRAWRFRLRTMLSIAAGIVLTVILFIVSMGLRYGFDHSENREFVIERLRNYSMSHLTAFSSWWDNGRPAERESGWGRHIFFGPAAHIGWADRQQGVYPTLFTDRYTVDSNLFTLHRNLVADFGTIGAAVALAVWGALSGIAYSTVRRSRRARFASVQLATFYAVLGWSHIVSLLGYTTVLLAFACYALALGHVVPRPHSDGNEEPEPARPDRA